MLSTFAIAQTAAPSSSAWRGLEPDWANLPSVRAQDGKVLFIRGTEYLAYSVTADKPAESGSLTSWKGWPVEWNSVDALARLGDDSLILFRRGEWLICDPATFSIVGEPQSIQASGAWPWPAVDSAVDLDATTTMIFRGAQFARYVKDQTGWKFELSGDYTRWEGWPAHWERFTNAVNPGNGVVYFFRGTEVLPYDLRTARFGSLSQFGPTSVHIAIPGLVSRATPKDNRKEQTAANLLALMNAVPAPAARPPESVPAPPAAETPALAGAIRAAEAVSAVASEPSVFKAPPADRTPDRAQLAGMLPLRNPAEISTDVCAAASKAKLLDLFPEAMKVCAPRLSAAEIPVPSLAMTPPPKFGSEQGYAAPEGSYAAAAMAKMGGKKALVSAAATSLATSYIQNKLDGMDARKSKSGEQAPATKKK